MEYLWSPWRMEYIQSEKEEGECVFCVEMGKKDGPENLIVFRGEGSFVILNRYPYTSGHVMVVPYQHVNWFENLEPNVRAEIMELTVKASKVLREIYHPQGFNIGANIGEAAGAGILNHVHMHVVPRWIGDTNFMSTLGKTRVLPEILEGTFWRVKNNWGDA